MTPEDIWAAAGPEDRRLAGLALNPAAPVDVLLRLLAEGADAVRMVLCRDRVLPEAVVDAVVVHPDRYTRSFYARNPYAEPEQRARLVDDPEWFVRAHLAQEPRGEGVCAPRPLPDDTVVRIIETYDAETVSGLGRQISPGLRRAMPTHPSAAVRRMGVAATAWDSLTPEVRAALLADPDVGVREDAARAEALDARQRDPDAVREDLPAHRCHARTHLLLYGALAPDVVAEALPGNAWLLAGNATTPADTVAVLAAHPDPEVRAHVAERPGLAPELLRALATDPDPDVRLAVSVHPALTEAERAAIDYAVPQDGAYEHVPVYDPASLPGPERVRALARSGHPLLRRRAAVLPHLPADLVALLAEDPDPGVRVLLAQNHPHAPAALLLRSFVEYTGPGRWHLTGHAAFPRAGLARYADDPDPALRRLALLDPETGPEAVDRLTRDPDPLVRADAARHPRLPGDRLAALLDDTALAGRAAANPALPVPTMRRLVQEGS
ncbi:hypothetical protein ACWCXC_19705 [Streptomyces sp. NPDC001515]